jgi:hypothetical protein
VSKLSSHLNAAGFRKLREPEHLAVILCMPTPFLMH